MSSIILFLAAMVLFIFAINFRNEYTRKRYLADHIFMDMWRFIFHTLSLSLSLFFKELCTFTRPIIVYLNHIEYVEIVWYLVAHYQHFPFAFVFLFKCSFSQMQKANLAPPNYCCIQIWHLISCGRQFSLSLSPSPSLSLSISLFRFIC